MTIRSQFSTLTTGPFDRPRGLGYGARLGSTYLRLAPSRAAPIRVTTRDVIAERQADTSNVYENTQDLGFKFVRQDLSGGQGLDWFPRRFDAQPIPEDALRFYDSLGLEFSRPVVGDEVTVKTAPAIFTSSIVNGLDMASSEDVFYSIGGSGINWWTDPPADGAADGTQAITATAPLRLAVDVSDRGVIWSKSPGSTWDYKPRGTTTWSSVANVAVMEDIENAWWVKDRFIVFRDDGTAAAKTLEEFDFGLSGALGSPSFAPTSVVFDTLDSQVLQVVDGGTAILALTSDGYVRSYVPAQQSADASDVWLEIRGRTAMPDGEQPIAIAENQGVVLIMTFDYVGVSTTDSDERRGVLRLYRAELLDERFDFILGNLQLLKSWDGIQDAGWGSGADLKQQWMASTRDAIYFGIDEDPGTETITEQDGEIWKFDVISGGLWRLASQNFGIDGGSIYRMQKWGTDLYFAVDTSAYRMQLERVVNIDIPRPLIRQTVGWVISPNITFGVNDDLNWVEAELVMSLDGPSPICVAQMWISTDPDAINDVNHSSWTEIINEDIGAQGAGEYVLTVPLSVTARQAAFKIQFTSTADGETFGFSEMVRFGVRAFPSGRDVIVDVPINVSDSIDVPYRYPMQVPGYGDHVHRHLMRNIGAGLNLELFDPPIVIRGVVDAIGEPVEFVSDRGSVGRYCLVRVRGNLITDQSYLVGMAFESDTADVGTVT